MFTKLMMERSVSGYDDLSSNLISYIIIFFSYSITTCQDSLDSVCIFHCVFHETWTQCMSLC